MKKQTALTVALALALGVGAQAVASAAPYSDVPSYAKEAVDKLYKDGLLDNKSKKFGPSDRVTRVEMAKLVAEAMTKLEKADAQQKAAIKKLAAEFKPELDALKADVDGVKGDINTINGRLDGVEKKLAEKQNVQFNGYYRARFENTKDYNASTGLADGPNEFRNRFRLDMTAPLDGNWVFKGRFMADINSSDTNKAWNEGTDNIAQAYVAGKSGDIDLVAFGRMGLKLGQGLLLDQSAKGGMDSFVLGTGNELKVVAGVTRVHPKAFVNLAVPTGNGSIDANSGVGVDTTVYFANLSAPVAKDLTMSASYMKDQGLNGFNGFTAYKSTSVGLVYKGLENLTLTGEYGQNDSDLAKFGNNGEKAKGWFTQLKYRGADKTNVGSYGVWAGYRNADRYFDAADLTTLDAGSNNAFNALSNVKGAEFGVEYTAFKNGVFTLKYLPLKEKEADSTGLKKDAKQFIGQLEVFF